MVTIIIASSGQVETLTRYMPSRLAYWTTLRMIRAKVWNEQELLDLMVADILYSQPQPLDGVLHARNAREVQAARLGSPSDY
ncbi:MAG: hypothetical protein MN733_02740 [Nitrososphaera sp.]|nr:hypothetical protein [Nitrososphaera sp.]